MEDEQFDEVLQQAQRVGQAFRLFYREVTGEEPDLESIIRHYPVVALGLAAGAGLAAGWWFGRRRAPQLPPPPESRRLLPPDGLSKPLEYVEDVWPAAVERVRDRLPEIVVSEEVKVRARAWFNDVLQRELRQDVDALAENVDERLQRLFRRAIDRFGPEPEVRLDDLAENPAQDTPRNRLMEPHGSDAGSAPDSGPPSRSATDPQL